MPVGFPILNSIPLVGHSFVEELHSENALIFSRYD